MSDDAGLIAFQIARLSDGNPRARANMLRAIAELPHASAELLAACEKLLADQTITLLSLPYRFGEIRWLAADAVAAVRGVLGIAEPVVIQNVMPSLTTNDVMRLATAAGMSMRGTGVDGVIETLRSLAAAGKVPRRTITL